MVDRTPGEGSPIIVDAPGSGGGGGRSQHREDVWDRRDDHHDNDHDRDRHSKNN